jgi:hypothetical protein
VRQSSLLVITFLVAACGGSPNGEPPATPPQSAAPASTATPASGITPSAGPSTPAVEGASSGIDKAAAATGAGIQTADRAMTKALTDPSLGDKAAHGVTALGHKLTRAIGAADKRTRNAALQSGLPHQRGILRALDASFITIEFTVGEETQRGRYVLSPDTTWVHELKVGDECTVTFMRDGERQVAVAISKNETEKPPQN